MNSVPVANYLAVAYIFWVVLGSLSSDAWNTPCLFIFCDKFNFFNQVRLSLRFELYKCIPWHHMNSKPLSCNLKKPKHLRLSYYVIISK